MVKPRILILTDDAEVRAELTGTIAQECDVTIAETRQDAWHAVSSGGFDAVVVGERFGGEGGDELVRALRTLHSDLPVVAAAADRGETLEAMLRHGAYDYVTRPIDGVRFLHAIERAMQFEALCRANRRLKGRLEASYDKPRLIGASLAMDHLREKVALLGRTTSPVLITGEPGVGKRTVARCIHDAGANASGPFVLISCPALPARAGSDELFGGERGREAGRMYAARGGTLVFEEIGSLDASLQEQVVLALGEGDTAVRDVRVIATSTRDLKEEVRAGRFREDLYYRINMVPLEVPPLRERREDIPLLIAHAIDQFARANGRERARLGDTAVDKLVRAHWRGNVRELHNAIERAIVLSAGRTLEAEHFRFESARDEQIARIEQAFRFGSIREMEKLMILNRLRENKENRTRSARTLDISVRTLRNKLHEYNVPPRYRFTEMPTVGV